MAGNAGNTKRVWIILAIAFGVLALLSAAAVFTMLWLSRDQQASGGDVVSTSSVYTADVETPTQGLSGIAFNKPSEMRAVWIVPGVDILKDGGKTKAEIQKQIDDALTQVKADLFNTVIVDVEQGGIDLRDVGGFDALSYRSEERR